MSHLTDVYRDDMKRAVEYINDAEDPDERARRKGEVLAFTYGGFSRLPIQGEQRRIVGESLLIVHPDAYQFVGGVNEHLRQFMDSYPDTSRYIADSLDHLSREDHLIRGEN